MAPRTTIFGPRNLKLFRSFCVWILVKNHLIFNIEMCFSCCFGWEWQGQKSYFFCAYCLLQAPKARQMVAFLPSSTGLRWGGTAPLSPEFRRCRLCLWAVAKPAELSASAESWRSGARGAQWEYPHLQIHWCLVIVHFSWVLWMFLLMQNINN